MENHVLNKTVRQDWLPANPWFWTFLGLGICLLNWATVVVLGESLNVVGAGCLFLGLMAAATGVILRLNSSAPTFVDRLAPPARYLLLAGLTLLFALIALTTTALLVLYFFAADIIGWRISGLFLLWIIVCPLSVSAMVYCARRAGPNCTVTPQEEGAALLLLTGLTIFSALWAFYNPENRNDWDTMRLFLSILFLVAVGAAPLLLVSQTLRRLAVSSFIVLHFLGISSAIMTPAPTAWLFSQLWSRVYQPYLEFIYMNNAYHFYSPEPGPASYLWFRMYFEDPRGKTWAHWIKIPDVDEKGWHKNTLSLEYQRMLAVTEQVIGIEPTPSQYMMGLDGALFYAPWYSERLKHSPNPPTVNIGEKEIIPVGLVIPFHPLLAPQQQFQQPNEQSRKLLSSYARHVCLQPHPDHPEYKVQSVKIYRVVHGFVDMKPTGLFVEEGMDPRDPTTYLPYYMGQYDPKGNLLDITQVDAKGNLIPGDPFLYWLLPMLRDPPAQLLNSPIKSWVAKHAGDEDWIYLYDETEKRHLLEDERKNLTAR